MPRYLSFDRVNLSPNEFVEYDNKGCVNISGTVRNLSDALAASNVELKVSASHVAVFLTDCGVAKEYYKDRHGKGNFGSAVVSALRYTSERESGAGDFFLGYSASIREKEETITKSNAHAILEEYGHLLSEEEMFAVINLMLFASPNGYGTGDGEKYLQSAVEKVKKEQEGENV